MTRSTRPRRSPAPDRDQGESAFTPILRDLLRRVPGARVAVLVDAEGETVDYAGAGDPYDSRITAAHWRIVLSVAFTQPSLAATRCFIVRAQRTSFIVQVLAEGYALILRLARGAGFRGWQRAVPACARRLATEAGWASLSCASWFPVDVECGAEGRPRRVAHLGASQPVEVLGRHQGPGAGSDCTWRVRMANGAEVTLACEYRRFWYADEPPDGLLMLPAPKNI